MKGNAGEHNVNVALVLKFLKENEGKNGSIM